jgi:Rad3-related DNA helicase
VSYTVAVRALCEFTAKQGDLDHRFTPSPSAQEGMAGHAVVAARRPPHYQTEVPLSGQFGPLLVRGRADGYDSARRRLEEIKTHRGDLGRMPDNQRHLHWAQLHVYGHLMCAEQGFDTIDLALVYFDIARQSETVFEETRSAADLQALFVSACSRFLAWAEQEMAHRSARDAWLDGLDFPHAAFRPGQRELAEAVYRAGRDGYHLLAQAPTGIGKTIGTLYPALKSAPASGTDKLFYLAAKTPGRQLALDACTTLCASRPATTCGTAGDGAAEGATAGTTNGATAGVEKADIDKAGAGATAESGPAGGAAAPAANAGIPASPLAGSAAKHPPLRVLELVARDKACEHPGLACHGEACPLAAGFYDRLPAARQQAAEAGFLDQARLREIALAHRICPYYLASEMARWSDVVVGDYNYYFDPGGALYALTLSHQWRIALLVDEAHNLLGRARSMYSAELSWENLRLAKAAAPPLLRKALARVQRAWPDGKVLAPPSAYQLLEGPPGALLQELQGATSAMTDLLAEQPVLFDPALQQFYFDALRFLRVAESFGDHSVCDLTGPARRHATVTLRNLLPAPFLKPRLALARMATLFSATLSPWHFHADTLGLSSDVAWLDVPAPFAARQIDVQLARHVSTRYRHRPASFAPIADLIAAQYRKLPGNYLAFFSSFDYLEQVTAYLQTHYPELPLRPQPRRMSETERTAFLAGFTDHSAVVGCAVLGGAFGEGIDLPGARLIGAFVATLGLPQVNPVNELIRERMERHYGEGYAYAYLYPGLCKVVQAAGRVIRTQTDEGSVVLIDDRFQRAEVQALLPAWWPPARIVPATRP